MGAEDGEKPVVDEESATVREAHLMPPPKRAAAAVGFEFECEAGPDAAQSGAIVFRKEGAPKDPREERPGPEEGAGGPVVGGARTRCGRAPPMGSRLNLNLL